MSARGVNLSVPVIAYEDWNISVYCDDEEIEEEIEESISKRFKFKNNTECKKAIKLS